MYTLNKKYINSKPKIIKFVLSKKKMLLNM